MSFSSIFDNTTVRLLIVLTTVLMLAGCGGGKSTPVTLTSITVTPSGASAAPGTTTQFTAAGSFSDGSFQDLTTLVVWSSSNGGVASVSNTEGSKGVATSLAAGTATISAAFGVISGSVILTVIQTNRAYVANSGDKSISVIDTTNNSVVATITTDVGIGPQGVAVNAAANRVYLTNTGSNTVSVIDTASNTVVATIPVGTLPQGVAVNPATNRAYITTSGNSALTVINTASNEIVATLGVGIGPREVAVIP